MVIGRLFRRIKSKNVNIYRLTEATHTSSYTHKMAIYTYILVFLKNEHQSDRGRFKQTLFE